MRRQGLTPSGWEAGASAFIRLRKTAINDAIRNGATMHEVREFAGHQDIRTTEVYFVRKEEDAEVAPGGFRFASRDDRADEVPMGRELTNGCRRVHPRALTGVRPLKRRRPAKVTAIGKNLFNL